MGNNGKVFFRAGIVCAFLLLYSVKFPQANVMAAEVPDDFRAAWVSAAFNLDFPSKKGLPVSELKKEIDAVVNRAVTMGLNALFVQVRPASDALYYSALFPWSAALTGTQGQAPQSGFDPLAYWVESAHAKGLAVHAWINPFRITYNGENITDVNKLSINHPARQNPSWVITYNGALYFDPGRPECRRLIADGAAEILRRYDVDGIHLDDYFYPSRNFADDASFGQYGNGVSRDDWRRENINSLIKLIQQTVKDIKPTALYGVSPTAIWMNASTNPLGSDTRGGESYHSSYADTRRWVKEGWLDYICPQIYWQIGYEIADFEKVFRWWEDVCAGTNVSLYVGHAAYREAEGDAVWAGEMKRQLAMVAASPVAKGSAFFRMRFLNGSVGTQIQQFYADTGSAPAVRMTKLTVAQPSGNVSVAAGAKGFNIFGTCDPSKLLYINGTQVVNRTPEGFFSYYAPLVSGANNFQLTQDGQETVTRVITLRESTTTTPPTQPPDSIIYYTDADTPRYAEVTDASVWLYPNNTTNGGSAWQLVKGQIDRVTAVTGKGDWVKLSCGGWAEAECLRVFTESKPRGDALYGGSYIQGRNEDLIVWKASAFAAVDVAFDGREMAVRFGMQKYVPPHSINIVNTIFSNIRTSADGPPAYIFTLREGVNLEGFYVDYLNGELRLHLKKRKQLIEGALPFAGFTFVIDAGHGAHDSGALGPMGAEYAEKLINLNNSKKLAERLTQLGAAVIMTRGTDNFLTLDERTELSRMYKPDMFISMHGNSLAETTDASTVRGLTVWYRNANALPLANLLTEELHMVNPYTTRRAVPNQSNFYVCRPSWAPSVLIEASFLCNIEDFAWLINDKNQQALADAVAVALLAYYK